VPRPRASKTPGELASADHVHRRHQSELASDRHVMPSFRARWPRCKWCKWCKPAPLSPKSRSAANWPPPLPRRLPRRPPPPTHPGPAGARRTPHRPGSRPLAREAPDADKTSSHGRTAAGPPALAPRRHARAPHARRHLAPLRLSGRLPGQRTGPVRLYTYPPTPLGWPDVVQSFRCGKNAARGTVYYGGAPCTGRSPIQSGPLF
jgi:Predicted membrane protein